MYVHACIYTCKTNRRIKLRVNVHLRYTLVLVQKNTNTVRVHEVDENFKEYMYT